MFQGSDAERHYHETGKFDYVNTGGYYHSLPGDPLRVSGPLNCQANLLIFSSPFGSQKKFFPFFNAIELERECVPAAGPAF